MPRAEPAELTRRLEAALEGAPDPLRAFLRRHSGLPGPRGNLELAGQFADLAAGLAGGRRAAAMWALVADLASVGPGEAPAGDPGEFLAFCGSVAAAGFVVGRGRRRGVWQVIRTAAEDPRWRLREAAAQAIQRALLLDWEGTRRVLTEWAAEGGWLLLRAVAAGVADPALLVDRDLGAAALQLHEVVLARFLDAPDRRDPAFRVLRQGLGYTLSVVVAAVPEPGFALLRALAGVSDRDLAWVLRSNLGKSRLARRHPDAVEEIRRLLVG